MENINYEHVIEGILFLSANQGVTLSELLLTLKVDQMTVEQSLDNLIEKYKQDGGLEIIYTNNTYKLVTKANYYDYFKTYASLDHNTVIGITTLETLAVIAYKQPVTKYDIESLRGIRVDRHIKLLLDRELIYVSGRSEDIGRANLYNTTENFLDFIGLNSLDELPSLKEFILDENSTSLLNFEEFNFKELSKKLLNSENTIEVENLDKETLQEIDKIENINIDISTIKSEEEME